MNIRLFILGLLGGILLSGCRAGGTLTAGPVLTPTARVGQFIPYLSATPRRVTPPAVTPATLTPRPSLTPTLRTHTVKAGEDLAGIALRYRVALKDLMAVNPTVTPRAMKIGTILNIPGGAPLPVGEAQATPTPAGVILSRPNCSLDGVGGAWCFGTAYNRGAVTILNLSVNLQLMAPDGRPVASRDLPLLLDLLQPGVTLPVAAYFPAPLPESFQAEMRLLAALAAAAPVDRYPPVSISGLATEIEPGGGAALVRGRLDGPDAGQVSVLAVAYTVSGTVAGVRRWDASLLVPSGQLFEFVVWGSAGAIQRVEVFAEARK